MAIHLDVQLEIDRRRLERQSEELRREMVGEWGVAGQESGAAYGNRFNAAANPRIKKAVDQAAEASDVLALKESTLTAARQKQSGVNQRIVQLESDLAKVRQNAVKDIDAETKLVGKLNTARLTQANVLKQVARAQLDVGKAMRDLDGKQTSLANLVPKIDTSAAVSQVGKLSNALADLGEHISPMGTFGSVAIVGLGAALVEVAGVAASAAQSIWLLPGAAAAAGAAFGTAALSLHGFDQAMKDMNDPKKFAKDLQGLAPEAQQAALEIQNLVPAFDQLRRATQNSFFAGLGVVT